MTATKAKIEWKEVTGAERYVIYYADCGWTSKIKRFKTTKSLSYVKTGLTKGRKYKFRIDAQKKIGGKWVTISTGYTVHFAAGNLSKDNKYTNAKTIRVKKAKVSIKVGKKSRITPTLTMVKAGKAGLGHTRTFRYLSMNTAIATVSRSGLITAKGVGTCSVYVIAENGLWKEIKVTVK